MRLRRRPRAEIPYPPVFRDWRLNHPGRVATGRAPAGVEVQMVVRLLADGGSVWKAVELTEADACLMAASLLDRSGEGKLSQRVLNEATVLRDV